MTALTTNTKRRDYFLSNRSQAAPQNQCHHPSKFQLSTKPTLSYTHQSLDEPVLSSANAVSRISRYLEVKHPSRREVHRPRRIRKFVVVRPREDSSAKTIGYSGKEEFSCNNESANRMNNSTIKPCKMLESVIKRSISGKINKLFVLRKITKQFFKVKKPRCQTTYNEKFQATQSELLHVKPVKKAVEEVPHAPFTSLTEEEKIEVHLAFAAERRTVLASHKNSNLVITSEILQCLRPKTWLNDEVINLYLELLKERENREPHKFLKCHFFNTFFYKKLVSAGTNNNYNAVRRWTLEKKLGYHLFECDKIFVPLHNEVHWCLAIINNKEKKFQYLDSRGGTDYGVLQSLANYFKEEVKNKSKKDINLSSWKQEIVKDLPKQTNLYDCGMFVLKYIDFHSRGLRLSFTEKHMPYFRLRTAKEILRLRAD